MKNLMIVLLGTLTFAQTAFAHNDPPGTISISKATELGVHRIERLVTLKKIDSTFQTNLFGMRAERTTESGATYKIYGYVSPDANNQSSTIAMLSDKTGKVLSYTNGPTYQPANPFNWPDKDALTLMENALHFVIEGWVQHPEVKPFYAGLMTIGLSPAKDTAGNLIALASVTSDDDARTLYISLKTDGNLIGYEIK